MEQQSGGERGLLWLWMGLIGGFVLWAYANSFQGPFVFDDVGEILEAAPVRAADGRVLWPVAHPTRTLGDLTFALNRRWGGTAPAGYHAVNLSIHLLTAALLLLLLRRVLRHLHPSPTAKRTTDFIAGAAVLVWSVHPLQTQAVTYLVQRHEVLVSFFYAAALYAYIRGREGGGVDKRWLSLSCVGAGLAMFSKEIAITLPAAALVWEGVGLRTSVREFRQKVLPFWLVWTLFSGLLVALFILASKIVPLPGGVWSVSATPWEYALTQSEVLLHYVRLLFWPDVLSIDYGWRIARGIGEVWPFLALVTLAVGGTMMGILRRRGWAVLPAWSMLVLLPTSSFLPVPDAAMEHRFYLVSALLLAALGEGAVRLGRRCGMGGGRRWMWGVVGSLVVILAVGGGLRTRERNRDYADPVRLWRGAVESNPAHLRAWFHLGRSYRERGEPTKARLAMNGILDQVPDYSRANPGILAEAARRDAEERRRIRYYALAHTFLGVLELERNRPESAVNHLALAVRVHPDPDALYNYALACWRLDRLAEAREAIERLRALDPNHSEAMQLNRELGPPSTPVPAETSVLPPQGNL